MARFVPTAVQPTGGGGRFIPAKAGVTTGGGRFIPSGGPAKPKGGGGRSGPFGFVENLAGDVYSSITGLPAGLVYTAEHPVGAVKGIGRSYAATYGSLFRGHPLAFAKTLYAHPLNPLLDVISVATLGAGSVAEAGRVAGAVGIIGKESRLANLSRIEHATLRSPQALAEAGRLKGGLEAALTPETPFTIAGRRYARNPLRRSWQKGIERALNKLPAETKGVGELARYGRELRRETARGTKALQLHKVAYDRALMKLNKSEHTALNLLAEGIHPAEYQGLLERELAAGHEVDQSMLRLLQDGEIRNLVENPTKKMVKAAEESRKLGELDAKVLIDRGWLTPEVAAMRPYLAARVVSGAKFLTGKRDIGQFGFDINNLPLETVTRPRTLEEARGRLREVDQTYNKLLENTAVELGYLREGGKLSPDQVREAMARGKVRAKQATGSAKALRKGQQGDMYLEQLSRAENDLLRALDNHPDAPGMDKLAGLVEERDRLRNAIQSPEAVFGGAPVDVGELGTTVERVRPAEIPAGAGVTEFEHGGDYALVGGKSIEEIKAELTAAGRPLPWYRPHLMRAERVANVAAEPRGGGVGVVKIPVHVNQAMLLRMGRIALEPDLLGPKFLRDTLFSYRDQIHQALEEGAIRWPQQQGLPEGYQYLRRRIGRTGTEKIPYTERALGDFERQMERILPDPEQLTRDIPGEGAKIEELGFTTDNLDEAAQAANGDRLIISEKFAKDVAGEFQRSSKAVRAFIEKPVQIWRSIILGYRLGFLTNNLVGNNLLWAIRYAGPRGMIAYLNMIRNSHGMAMVRRLLKMTPKEYGLTPKVVEELFPEQAGAITLGRSQVPEGMSARQARALRAAKAGIMPATQAAAETGLRRAALETEIRRSPEFRRVYATMKKDSDAFGKATRQTIEQHPDLQRYWEDRVNSALGDYLSLGQVERSVLRGAFPFYAWYRAILTITLKLPVEAPGRTLLLSKIAQVGADINAPLRNQVPTYLRGAIPIAGLPGMAAAAPGTRSVLTTGGLNPFETVNQIGEAVGTLISGKPGEAARPLGGQLNPYLQAAIEQLTGRALYSGGPIGRGTSGNPIQDWLEQNIHGVAAIPAATIGGLPQVQLLSGPSKLYPQRDFLSQLYASAGLPVKRYETGVARARAAQQAYPQP